MNARPLLLITLFLPLLCPAQVYETRDEQGNVVYTDVPPKEGAPEVKLPPMNVLDAPDPIASQRQKAAPAAVEVKYQRLAIVSPANNETIYINASNIPIEISLSPDVNRSAGHRLELLWDGRLLAQNQLKYQISEADRGEHLIQAQVVDSNNRVLISATPVTVHIKQPIAAP